MSSELQTALAELQLNDYISLVLATTVVYDYCLVIPKEVTYIWKRPWTWVSTLYLLIRYVGCLSALTAAFNGSTLIPGPVKVRHSSPISCQLLNRSLQTPHDIRLVSVFKQPSPNLNQVQILQGYIIYVLSSWADTIFWMSADLAMILRVYAMYKQSKIILGVLLVVYITQVVIFAIGTGIADNPELPTVSIFQLLDVTVCNIMISTPMWTIAAVSMQCILNSLLCTLVVVKFVRDSLRMYQATRTWQMNKYIGLLTRDGFFYFLATLFNSIINLFLDTEGSLVQGLGILLPALFANVLLYTLTPRFVINVRELYALDSQGRLGGDIDTGFGLTSQGGHGVGTLATIGTIAFADGNATGGLEDGEEIALAEKSGGKQVLIGGSDVEEVPVCEQRPPSLISSL
ncbi:hypothetical protein EV363DRAFT_1452836 [Boletus edulis]|uniref:DUF6533 domain-containing protein n=1 Tax=Boletus edulis BED1 TaxID=1328754 RepID=A0AAD4CAP3_BOLED|nr:hypothetical protein EV363DRAFT_1452836 [Boletus edulis]KAF8452758.1 hypothetical protein L210DRAFT_3639230 [Boletus edulis BED1]